MLNKILIFGGLALMSILVIENIVIPTQAYVFISNSSTAWLLSLTSAIIGIGIGFGIKGFIIGGTGKDDENLDF